MQHLQTTFRVLIDVSCISVSPFPLVQLHAECSVTRREEEIIDIEDEQCETDPSGRVLQAVYQGLEP